MIVFVGYEIVVGFMRPVLWASYYSTELYEFAERYRNQKVILLGQDQVEFEYSWELKASKTLRKRSVFDLWALLNDLSKLMACNQGKDR